MSNAIAQVIEENGGRILYDSTVDRIRVEKGVVKGVELSGGEALPARAVVSNASAPTTFHKMVPAGAVSKDYLEKLNSYKPSISSFLIWLGVNQELKGKIKAFSTHVSGGLGPEADYRAESMGILKKVPLASAFTIIFSRVFQTGHINFANTGFLRL